MDDERLLDVLYEICNFSDLSGEAAHKIMSSRTNIDFTVEEAQEALYRMWEVIHKHRHPDS